MKKKWMILTTILVAIMMTGALVGPVMSQVEQPEYTVISSQDNIEIREYKPMIIARVEVDGARKDAIGDGFRLLADYIFGNNSVKQDIAMTAPVQQETSQKIAMTAPVQQESSGDSWKVSFVMPSEYSIADLPKPNNNRVVIEEVPTQKHIAITFSGSSSDRNVAEHEEILMQYIAAHNFKPRAPVKYAFYNPPWTLPFLRRNEVMVAVE